MQDDPRVAPHQCDSWLQAEQRNPPGDSSAGDESGLQTGSAAAPAPLMTAATGKVRRQSSRRSTRPSAATSCAPGASRSVKESRRTAGAADRSTGYAVDDGVLLQRA